MLDSLLFIITIPLLIAIASGIFMPFQLDKMLRGKYAARKSNWEAQHEAYMDFLDENGGMKPRKKYGKEISNEEYELALWEEDQRFAYIHAILSREHFLILKSEGFDFKNQSKLKEASSFPTDASQAEAFTYPRTAKNIAAPIIVMIISAIAIIATAVFGPMNEPIRLAWSSSAMTFPSSSVNHPFIYAIMLTILMALMVYTIFTDIRGKIIPVKMCYLVFFPLAVLYSFLMYGVPGLMNAGISLFIAIFAFGGLDFLASKLLKKKALGGGDKTMILVMSVAVGAYSPYNLGLLLIMWSVAQLLVFAVGALSKKITLKSSIPAGPTLVASFFATMIIPAFISIFPPTFVF